ncbi:MAG: inner membrane-spanning protein YciB [Minwuia sp.]|uniref:inner membrane-spanning protein YciB n=1 Tax=Minwuia sp. TaxID=2493630 RepID=UPI003A891D9E
MTAAARLRERYLNQNMIVEIAPAAVFLIANFVWDILTATAAVIAATVVVVVYASVRTGRMPALAITTLLLALTLGGASLIMQDETFIQIKPTLGRALFGAAVLVGLFFQPTFLERALGAQLHLSPKGWRILTYRWAGFAFMTAVANEVFRGVLTTDNWVLVTTVSGPLSILGYILITRLTAPRYWTGPVS